MVTYETGVCDISTLGDLVLPDKLYCISQVAPFGRALSDMMVYFFPVASLKIFLTEGYRNMLLWLDFIVLLVSFAMHQL